MGKLKYSDQEIADAIERIQRKDPLFTEANICAELNVSRDYILERAKKSKLISDARKKAFEIRETAWVARGIDGMSNREFNATVYIWMTRNILSWRDKHKDEDQPQVQVIQSPSQISPDQIVEIVKKARGNK